MPSNPPIVVLVPVKLDAFVLNPAVCNGGIHEAKIAPITQPNYTFLRVDGFVAQNDVLPHVDLHLSSPSTTNPRLMNLGTGKPRRRTGVYLHWSLPRAYRRATEDQGCSSTSETGTNSIDKAPEFPTVPTRWLVIRRLHKEGMEPLDAVIPELEAWVVESDKPNDINDLDADVDLEVDVSPFIETGKPEDIKIARQAEVFIGGKTTAQDWKEDERAGERQPLTVVTSSNPLFADYQPHNSNVFSMLDHFEYGAEKKQLTKGTASYYVLGWHSSLAADILNGLSPSPLADRLRARLMELTPSNDENTAARVLCHGAMYHVKWHAEDKPNVVPADEHSQRLNGPTPVAVGTTVLDALLAFIQANAPREKMPGSSGEYSTSSLEADIWRIHGLLLARDDGVDGQREAVDMLNHHNYDRVPCGTVFHLAAPDTTGENETLQRPLEKDIVVLAELNQIQYALDLTTRTVRKLRWDLFSLWWKYVSTEENNDPRRPAHELQSVAALSTRLNTLIASIASLTAEVEGKKAAVGGRAKPAAMPSAYQLRDPTLLVTGISSGWPHDFMDPLKVRLKHQIMTAGAEDLETDTPGGWSALQATIKRTLPTDLLDAGSALAEEFLLLSPPDNNGKPVGILPLYHDPDPAAETDHGKPLRDQWQDRQPWFPLFLEWEVEYTHTSKESWILEERLSASGPVASRKLRYGMAEDSWPDERIGVPDSRRLSGRTLTLPQPNFSLKSRIQHLFDTTPLATLDKCLPPDDREKLLKNVDKFPFMSARLTGFTDHLVTRVPGTHIKPNVLAPGKIPLAIHEITDNKSSGTGFTTDNLELIGRESDLTPYGTMVMPVADYPLFKPVTHGRFKFTKINIIDKFGQAIHALNPIRPTAPCPAHTFHPCVGEFYSSPLPLPASTDEPVPDEYVYVPPQINQFARLNCSFVVEDQSVWRPTTEWDTDKTNPIWGWVLVNAPDNGIQLFLADGTFYRAVRVGGSEGASTSAKWLPNEPPVGLDVTSTNQLERLAERLADPTYLKAFIEMIYEATRNGSSAPTAYSHFVSSLVGKPFALANMGWSLELALNAYTNESTLKGSTNQATLDIKDPEPGLFDYEFSIRFGDQDQVYDGLAGYFNTDGTKPELDFDHFYTYRRNSSEDIKSSASDSPLRVIDPTNYPVFHPYWVSPDDPVKKTLKSPAEIDKERNEKLTVFGAILDPFTAVHAYSSFLPTTALQLPPFTWQSAMSKMTAFFHLGPLLVPTDVSAFQLSDTSKTVPIPALGLAEWSWQQPRVDMNGQETSMDLGIETLDQRPRFEEAPYTAIEGYLKLMAPLSALDIKKQRAK